jgi:hypothetical protein
VLFAAQNVFVIYKLNLPLSQSKALSQQVGGAAEYQTFQMATMAMIMVPKN